MKTAFRFMALLILAAGLLWGAPAKKQSGPSPSPPPPAPPFFLSHGLTLNLRIESRTSFTVTFQNQGQEIVKLWHPDCTMGRRNYRFEFRNAEGTRSYIVVGRMRDGSSFGEEMLELKPGGSENHRFDLTADHWLFPEDMPRKLKDWKCRVWYFDHMAASFKGFAGKCGVTQDPFVGDWSQVPEMDLRS